ncbi:DUF2721 domain-containing protein [Pedobacter sp. SYSU D00535]|uniref:DUF2721 domain-containing protein n=1 Tax=Pedobacter sp. SYSU D00535 TaxID=2810308 RepID=UPI001A9609CA|nr:DUF2721 domain-containing protein [Pedobacter sp. SYSU D00535]
MELTLTTPALLFPAISLLLLAYTNRFLALASLIRNLKSQYVENQNPNLLGQISNIRTRIFQVRNMQACAILSFFMCVLTMWLLYNGEQLIAKYLFGLSLLLLMISLFISLREIQISVKALELELSDVEEYIRESERKK